MAAASAPLFAHLQRWVFLCRSKALREREEVLAHYQNYDLGSGVGDDGGLNHLIEDAGRVLQQQRVRATSLSCRPG